MSDVYKIKFKSSLGTTLEASPDHMFCRQIGVTGQQYPRLVRGETYTCEYNPYR